MKKVFALILTMVLVFGLAVPAFAAKSPNGQEYFKVVIIDGNDHKDAPQQGGQQDDKHENITHTTVVKNKSIVVKANPSKGKFDGWKIYKADGKPAVEGVDYKVLGAFSLTDDEIEIIPLSTIVITANYNDVVTETIVVNDEDVAPPTGDNTVVVLSAVALIALCGAVVAKKQLAK
jgi:hypothetical protein